MTDTGCTTSHLLSAVRDLKHGFCGRVDAAGNTLNVSHKFATDPAAAEQALLRAIHLVFKGERRLARVEQVHSNLVHTIIDAEDTAQVPRADALVTNRRDIALGIVTADCAPVLLVDPQAQIIGAAHAGWRGAVSGILAATLAAMQKIGARPNHVVAAIGPSISGLNYEVGDKLRNDVVNLNPLSETFFFVPPGKSSPHFDLPGFIKADLARLGVVETDDLATCTYANSAKYYSHRRATHTGEPQGRQIALIGLNPQNTP